MTISYVVLQKEFEGGSSIFMLQLSSKRTGIQVANYEHPAVDFKNSFVQKLSAL